MIEKNIESISPVLMTTIVDRGEGDSVSAVFTANGVYLNILTHGSGTASKKLLSFLGFGETEKDVLFSCMPYKTSRTVLSELDSLFRLKKAGYGVAFCVPMNDAAAAGRGMGVCQNAAEDRQGGHDMEEHQHDLIVAITAQGSVDEVMDIAKAHGATGGTVLRARGVGAKEAEKFFGITIQAEKDMIFIVVKKELRVVMMNAIAEEKGPRSEAKSIVFSLPVNGIAGMKFESCSETTI